MSDNPNRSGIYTRQQQDDGRWTNLELSEEEAIARHERRKIAAFLRSWARMNTTHGGPKTVSITLDVAASAVDTGSYQEELPPWIDEEP